MATPRRSAKQLFPNPFYVLLLVASTLFVLTTFGYLMVPFVREKAAREQAAGARPGPTPLADWLDRNAPTALGVEIIVMVITGGLAMATDRWFPERSKKVSETGPGAGS